MARARLFALPDDSPTLEETAPMARSIGGPDILPVHILHDVRPFWILKVGIERCATIPG